MILFVLVLCFIYNGLLNDVADGYENFCALCSFRAVLREYVGSCKDAISPYVIFNNLESILLQHLYFFLLL